MGTITPLSSVLAGLLKIPYGDALWRAQERRRLAFAMAQGGGN